MNNNPFFVFKTSKKVDLVDKIISIWKKELGRSCSFVRKESSDGLYNILSIDKYHESKNIFEDKITRVKTMAVYNYGNVVDRDIPSFKKRLFELGMGFFVGNVYDIPNILFNFPCINVFSKMRDFPFSFNGVSIRYGSGDRPRLIAGSYKDFPLFIGLTEDSDIIYSSDCFTLRKICYKVIRLDNAYVDGEMIYGTGKFLGMLKDVFYSNFDTDTISHVPVFYDKEEEKEKEDYKLNNNSEEKRIERLDIDGHSYGCYLTGNHYDVNPAVGRERELRDLQKKLLVPKKGVILVGDAGVGKTSIVEGLAYKISKGEVCDLLSNKEILSITTNELLAGCIYRGSFEEKIEKLCQKLIELKNTILFIDELHTSLGSGKTTDSSIDLSNILKPYISNDLIKVIGCTTRGEFDQFNSDLAYRRRFNIVDVLEQDDDSIKEIIKSNIINNKFGININLSSAELDKISDIIFKFSKRRRKLTYQSIKNPDSSINILMSIFSYLAIENIKNPKFQDFIDGMLDDDNLSLLKFDREYLNSMDFLDDKENEVDDLDIDRSKIFVKSSFK